jgi:hypothetical protein
MASAASANGSTHSLSAGPATAGNSSSGGGMEELLPLVLQLTNAESVSAAVLLCCVMLRLLATYRVCVRGVLIF